MLRKRTDEVSRFCFDTSPNDVEGFNPKARQNSPFPTNGCVLCDQKEKCCIICVHALQVMKLRPLEVGRRQRCGCLFIRLKCGMPWPAFGNQWQVMTCQ